MIPQENEGAWRLAETGWIYLVGDARRAAGPIESVGGAMRKVVVTDPEGSMITFAEELSR